MHLGLKAFIASIAAFGVAIGFNTPALAQNEVVNGVEVVPNQALIELSAEVLPGDEQDALAELDLRVIEDLSFEDTRTFLVGLDPFISAETQLRIASQSDLVEIAEPNFEMTSFATADETSFTDGSLWGMLGASTNPANTYGSNAAGAWANNYTGSSDVYVAVLDSGIDVSHPDLAANIWVNSGETAGDGIDNDGNGFIDDVNGFDFVNDDGTVFDAGEDDHGTHVAGTIGAIGGNGAGVAGVTWNTKMISVKMIGSDGTATIADAIEAVNYTTMLRTKLGLDIIAINASWGGPGNSEQLENAIRRSGDAGIIFVASSGNGNGTPGAAALNLDTANTYPAEYDCRTELRDYDCIVSVGAIDSSGNMGSFSNYSSTQVDIAAPGVGVLSTLPGNTYGLKSGTSMAAPHVTGALALCVGSYRGTSAQRAIAHLIGSAAPTASLAGMNATSGRLDVAALVNNCVSDAVAFSGTQSEVYASAIYTDRIRLDWSDSVLGDFEQEIQMATGPAGCAGTFSHYAFIGPGLTNYPVVDLDESEFHCFRIRANNKVSNSSYARSNVSITWTSNLPFVSGKVLLADGTPVAGAPVKWVASGQYQSISTSGVVVKTDASGNYVTQVSDGTPGILSVNMPISSNNKKLMTSPIIPWGLETSGQLTVSDDVELDINLPPQNVVTFRVTDNGVPVQGARASWEGLAKYCVKNSFSLFTGAVDTSCRVWPFGTSSSNNFTDANGELTLAFPDPAVLSDAGSYTMSFTHPTISGKVASATVTPTSSGVIPLEMGEVVTLSGQVTLSDATTAVQGIYVHWLPRGTYDDSGHALAFTTQTDAGGNYTMPVTAGVDGRLYVSTSRGAGSNPPTTPRVPWGLNAGGRLVANASQTVNITLPEQQIVTVRATEYQSATAVPGAKLQYSGLAEYCENGRYTAFAGASDSKCNYWPTGFSGSQVLANGSGEVSIAVLDNQYFSATRKRLFSVSDPVLTARVSPLTINVSEDTTIVAQMPGPAEISGRVLMADGVTPVSGVPIKWVADSQYSGSGYSSAATVTDASGAYSLDVSLGTPGELFVDVTRDAATQPTTSPQLPWGLRVGGKLSAASDVLVDVVLPYINYVTISVEEMSRDGNGDPIAGAEIRYEGLAKYCNAGGYSPFASVTASSCTFWPAGYSSRSPETSAAGVVVIPVLDDRYFSDNSYTFSAVHPMDAARVESVTATITADRTFELTMPGTPSRPEMPVATPGENSVTLDWDEPWNGGAFIDYYQIWVSLNADGPFELVSSGSCAGQVAPNLRTCEVTGLTPGVTYYFAIIAKNVVGASELSISVASIPTAAVQDFAAAATPTISGSMVVDQQLTAQTGVWDAGVSFSYVWLRDGQAIAGANQQTYQVSIADIGSVITVAVTGQKDGYNTQTKTSSAGAAVSAGTLTLTPVPTIAGTTTEGETLTLTAGSWDAGVSLSYQWLRAGNPISGATSTSYVLTAADVGATITVSVTGTKAGYQPVSETSSPTATVAEYVAPAPVLSTQTLTPTPVISGEQVEGETLTADAGTWDAGVSLSYQWLRNGVAVPGATEASYTLGAADLGSNISVAVTGTKTGFTDATEVSVATDPIASPTAAEEVDATLQNTPTPAISGTASVGSVLNAQVGQWDEGAILSYKWLRDGVAIFGADGTSYTPKPADVGGRLTFAVIGSKNGLNEVTKVSAPTEAVSAPAQGSDVGSGAGSGAGGGGGFSPAPITDPIPVRAIPLPQGKPSAVLGADGSEIDAVLNVAPGGKSVGFTGSGWELSLAASSGLAVSPDGAAELTSGSSMQISAGGFEPGSRVSAYLVPEGYIALSSLSAFLALASYEPISLGDAEVTESGTVAMALTPTAAAGDYVLQISGYTVGGVETTIAISATVVVSDQPFTAWTSKQGNQVKVYAKNPIGAGKVRMLVDGKEIAWVRALDETDPKLRQAGGFYYLVRTVNLVVNKKIAIEIYLDDDRVWRAAYGLRG